MNKMVMGFFGAGLVVCTVACTGGADPGMTSTTVETTASSQTLAEACNANVMCHYEGTVKTIALGRGGHGCELGAVATLAPGGEVLGEPSLRWDSTTVTVSICDRNNDCIDCITAPPSATPKPTTEVIPAPPPKSCKGFADFCSNISVGMCSDQAGCAPYMAEYAAGIYQSFCGGRVKECEDFDSESACSGQRGCRWF